MNLISLSESEVNSLKSEKYITLKSVIMHLTLLIVKCMMTLFIYTLLKKSIDNSLLY